MPDKKLTDSEIIKALECCKNDGIICFECPYKKTNGCMEKLSADALDLIHRLQAEKEQYKANSDSRQTNEYKNIDIAHIKAKAYKEFAKRLMSYYAEFDEVNEIITLSNLEKAVKDCLKELVGDTDA